MTNSTHLARVQVHRGDIAPSRFRAEVLSGLKKPQKELPSKYFYDERGSQLFEQICDLDEYYVTRTELGIMQRYVGEMAEWLGPDALLIEYGSGSSLKTRILLDHLPSPAAYVPIDISEEALVAAAESIAEMYPALEVLPVHADYTMMFDLPEPRRASSRRVVYFPGSTLGNFDPLPAKQFLERAASVVGEGGLLLIGVDLKKDPLTLHRAYNDAPGVTAAFNLNLIERINRDLGADFRVDRFAHYAFYNPVQGRVEMHLISLDDQSVSIGGVPIVFRKGESIWTESSYKYTLNDFDEMATMAGFEMVRAWTDDQGWFAVISCVAR